MGRGQLISAHGTFWIDPEDVRMISVQGNEVIVESWERPTVRWTLTFKDRELARDMANQLGAAVNEARK